MDDGLAAAGLLFVALTLQAQRIDRKFYRNGVEFSG